MKRHRCILLFFILLSLSCQLRAQSDERNFKVSEFDQVAIDTNLNDSVFYFLEDAVKVPLRVSQLIIESKHLNALPLEVLMFKNMKVLDISHNRIMNLPDSLFLRCPKLEEVRYAGNELTRIPSVLYTSSLKVLDLSENHLKILPDSIVTCQSIEELDVHANDIDSLPSTGVVLKKLKSLILSENPLNKTSPWIFNQPLLKILFLDHTALDVLDASLCKASQLKLLNIEDNELHNFPLCICQMKGLKVLMMEGNKFATTTTDDLQKCLPSLKVR